MDLAKEAAISAAELLGEYDQIGIVAFEDQPRWAIPPTPATDLSVVQAAISEMQPGGGTEIYPALKMAYDGLAPIDAKVKHIILLTDGEAPRGDYPGLTAADARRQHHPEHDRHRQRRRHQPAPGARPAGQRPLLRRQRSVRSAAAGGQGNAAGPARGDRRGGLQAAAHLVQPGPGRHRRQRHARSCAATSPPRPSRRAASCWSRARSTRSCPNGSTAWDG